MDYFESHPKENVEKLLKEYFQGKTILVEDPFGTDDSKKQVDQFKASVLATMGNVVSVVKRGGKVDMLLKLCEEIGDETHYSQSVKRMYESGIAFQHMIHHGGGKEDDVPEANYWSRIALSRAVCHQKWQLSHGIGNSGFLNKKRRLYMEHP